MCRAFRSRRPGHIQKLTARPKRRVQCGELVVVRIERREQADESVPDASRHTNVPGCRRRRPWRPIHRAIRCTTCYRPFRSMPQDPRHREVGAAGSSESGLHRGTEFADLEKCECRSESILRCDAAANPSLGVCHASRRKLGQPIGSDREARKLRNRRRRRKVRKLSERLRLSCQGGKGIGLGLFSLARQEKRRSHKITSTLRPFYRRSRNG
jgi:hypothetical protein